MKMIKIDKYEEKKIKKEKVKNKYDYRYLIVSKIFPHGDDREVIFEIKATRTSKCFKISALQIIQNDNLIKEFCAQDVCDIAYTAAWEMFLQEKSLLCKEYGKFFRCKND